MSPMEKALRKAGAGRALSCIMPWPDAPPQQSRLHLFVRYWLPGGRAVEQDREITITPSNKLASRWTPRSEQRPERRRRINLAENLDPQPPELPASSRSGNARDAAETFRNVPDGSRDSGRQDGARSGGPIGDAGRTRQATPHHAAGRCGRGRMHRCMPHPSPALRGFKFSTQQHTIWSAARPSWLR